MQNMQWCLAAAVRHWTPCAAAMPCRCRWCWHLCILKAYANKDAVRYQLAACALSWPMVNNAAVMVDKVCTDKRVATVLVLTPPLLTASAMACMTASHTSRGGLHSKHHTHIMHFKTRPTASPHPVLCAHMPQTRLKRPVAGPKPVLGAVL
jgi:hypothetical protein